MIWTYIWLAVIVVALIVEFTTTEMVSIWFVGGGVIAMILSLVGLPWYIHLPIFIAVSLVLLLCFRRIILKYFNNHEERTNAETVIGKEFKLLTDVTKEQMGTIKVNDVVWNVIAVDGKEISAGNYVKIKEIKGNKYLVEEL